MSLFNHPAFLPAVLRIDAATCVATGLLMTAGSSLVAAATEIPSVLLTAAGASLFPIAAFMAFTAGRVPAWPLGVWIVILGNVGWVLASVWLLASDAINPNTFGVVFVLIQAGAVTVLAALEYVGLRRLPVARLTPPKGGHSVSPDA